MRKIIILLICCVASSPLRSQETAFSNDAFDAYKRGKAHFEDKLYGPAKTEMAVFLDYVNGTTSEKHRQYLLEAEQIYKTSAFHLNLPEAESELVEFVEFHSPDPIIIDPVQALGSYYYNEKQYDKSIYFYDKIDLEQLKGEDFSEASFKRGYSHFVKKEFQNAKFYFSRTKDFRNKYYYPSNYYNGMCQYFEGDYNAAVASYERVSLSSAYSPYIPYYITQIYFAQDQFEKLITYGDQVLRQTDLQKRKEIRLLLGQAYFKRKLYIKALPHLEYYEANTAKLTQEEFYQLAFSQYQLKNYEDAVENFQELTLLDSKLGQLVNYYLADCYINLGEMNSARTAFKKVSQMDYQRSMQEESTFNYGKLSAELNHDRESINTLVKIPESSLYFVEARKIVNDILLNSGDYENSLAIMESLDQLSPDLKATYQLISFNRAIQLIDEGDKGGSRIHFSKVNRYPINENLIIRSKFWLSYMLSQEERPDESIASFDDYFNASNGKGPFPEESSPFVGHYIQAYNHLKTNNYSSAEFHFKNAIVGMNIKRDELKNEYLLNRVLPDALLRAGDCLFKQNNYEEAALFYNQSIDRQANGFVYAMYQRGLIEGLLGKPYDKILTLEKIVQKYPVSEYADDALLQLGDTYLALGNTGPALLSFNRIVTYYKGKTNHVNAAYLKLGLISYNQGDAAKALSYYKEVFKNNPNSKESQEALIAIEEIYIDDLGQTDEYFAFLGTVPGYELTAFTRDSLTYQIGQQQYEDAEYEKAVTSFDNYLKSYSKGYYRLEASYYRGECNSILKQYNSALKDYEFLVQEGYNDFYIRSLKKSAVISYNFTQNFNKAYKYYSAYSEEAKEEDQVYEAYLGALRSGFRTGKNEGVKKFSSLVINHPLATTSEKNSAYYYLGKASYTTGQIEQALVSFKKLMANGNNQAAEANYLIAKIYYDRADLDLTESQINYTIENSSNYAFWIAKTLLLYADVYLSRDDIFNARAAVEAVIENYKDNESIALEANSKLKVIMEKESQENRIKTENKNQLELDTSGNGQGK